MFSRSAMRWLSAVCVGVLVALNAVILAAPANAASAGIQLPFRVGQTWFVCQGYNTAEIDHTGNQVNALDLSIAPSAPTGTYGCVGGPSASAGQPVLAPAGGTIVRHCCSQPVNDMVCMAKDGGGSLMIGHMTGLPAVGAHVGAGAKIGTVNPPGTTTNEGNYSHIHIAVYASNNCGGISIPFDDSDGSRFNCAPNLPSDGSMHQYYRTYLSRCGTASSRGNAALSLEFTLPGISQIGVDNNVPAHPQRIVTVTVLNSSRHPVFTRAQTAGYSSTNGDYSTSVNLGSTWVAGKYFVTIRVSNSLIQTLGTYSGSQYQISANTITYLPRTPLISGDVNGDNAINILDYNILLNCIQNTGCSSSQRVASDLNDNGTVDMVDYNIWLRSNGAANANCSNGICVYNKVW